MRLSTLALCAILCFACKAKKIKPANINKGGSTLNHTIHHEPSEHILSAETILQKKEVPILCYHRIREFKPSDTKSMKDYIVTPNNFRLQIKMLADSGFHAILPDQLYNYLAYGEALPAKPVMLTFDDSEEEHFSIADNELKKYGFKAVYFIMTVTMNRPGYLQKDQIKKLSEEGNVIAAHTWDHHNVKKYTETDWAVQLDKPMRQLQDVTGKKIEYFAYPFGLWNTDAIPQLKKRGIKAAFQLVSKRDSTDPLYTIRRSIVPGEWNNDQLMKCIRGNFK